MSQNIKKVTIENKSLPDLTTKDGFYGYKLRYRVVSEDRNRFSAWSPMYRISAEGVIDVSSTQFTTSITAGTANKKLSLAWIPNSILKNYNFDIFIKTNSQTDYSYYASTSSTSFDILFTNGSYTNVRCIVQIASSDKIINKNLQMFETDIISLA